MKALKYVVVAAVVPMLLAPTAAWADSEKAQTRFERAYFLETHQGDLAGAAELYGAVAQSRGAPQALVAEAKQRRQSCLEDLRSADLAALMPAESIAFVELREPGRHVENLAGMLGLLGDPLANLTRPAGKGGGIPIPDAPGLVVPPEIYLSPGIVNELRRFRGVAAAITGIEAPPAGNPDLGGVQGVVVLHPGDDQMLRGALETFAQFVVPAEPISGFPTLEVAPPGIVVSFTNRLVVAGTSRGLVAGVVDRLSGRGGESLADRADMVAMAEQRRHSLAFAFVDVKRAVATAHQHLQQDPDAMQALAMAQGLFDIRHAQSVSASLGTTGKDLYAEVAMALDEGHANLVYNLVRTPPMSGRTLESVPAGAAGFVGIGINPATSPDDAARAAAKADTLRYVTGLDLGRELFANIEEITAFVVPGESRYAGEGPPIPDVGILIATQDPAKSRQLWEHLLSIPSMFMGIELPEPQTRRIAGLDVEVYPMPDGVKIHVALLDRGIVISPSGRAVAAAAEARRSGKSILKDPAMKAAVDRLTETTSIVAVAHAGRCAQVAAQFCPPGDLDEVRMVGAIAGSTLVMLQADETPTRLRVAAHVTGLPQVKDVIEMMSRIMMPQAGKGQFPEQVRAEELRVKRAPEPAQALARQ